MGAAETFSGKRDWAPVDVADISEAAKGHHGEAIPRG